MCCETLAPKVVIVQLCNRSSFITLKKVAVTKHAMSKSFPYTQLHCDSFFGACLKICSGLHFPEYISLNLCHV